MFRTLVCLAATALFGAPGAPQRYHGRVIGVVDGDTIRVLVNRNTASVRLYGIDAPERKQPFGTQARSFTSRLTFGREVAIQVRGTDRNGRWIAEVLLPDGRNAGEELLKAGYAWWFRRYASKDRRLADIEADARRRKTGLWAAPGPIPPWIWRRR